jgi:hypothetical protein
MIMVSSAAAIDGRRQLVAVVVTVAKGYDLAYIWKGQGETAVERSTSGYYISAAQAGVRDCRRPTAVSYLHARQRAEITIE